MNTGKALSHAYLLVAPPEEGFARAQSLAQEMLCTGAQRPCGLCRNCRKAAAGIHPDILVVSRPKDDKGREKREIYVEQVREIVSSAVILPNEAEKKVYIIRDAGTMNTAAQNALLKILEEPPAFVAFVLVADNAAQLLETVRSRCAVIYLGGGGESAPDAAAAARAADYLAAAAAGDRVALLRFTQEQADMTAADAAAFAAAVREAAAAELCGRTGTTGLPHRELLRLAQLMDKTEEYLRFNVGLKHILGMLSVETILK